MFENKGCIPRKVHGYNNIFDICAPSGFLVPIEEQRYLNIDLGYKLYLPPGYYGILYTHPKQSKKGIRVRAQLLFHESGDSKKADKSWELQIYKTSLRNDGKKFIGNRHYFIESNELLAQLVINKELPLELKQRITNSNHKATFVIPTKGELEIIKEKLKTK